MSDVKAIAFYLPQFHPIPENDKWWGKGFTEWTNVGRARPLFPGHYQPHVPADLGYYDLRLSETRLEQARLAAAAGIYGFCYYHYWFNGQRLIERPFNEVLQRGEPDFPFCLCWANETWSRRWLGEERDILMEQTYSDEDDRRHGEWLAAAFADPRYIRVHGRPLFLIYRPTFMPDPQRTTDRIRKAALHAGVAEPWLVGVDSHKRNFDYRSIGFDETLNFTPQLGLLTGAFNDAFSIRRLLRNFRHGTLSGRLKIYDYEDAHEVMNAARPGFDHIPSVFVGWDNTPRRGEKGVIISNSTPEKFRRILAAAVEEIRSRRSSEPILFINAWNEWAEGNHLEPDLKHGRGYLDAVRQVLCPADPDRIDTALVETIRQASIEAAS